MNRWIPQYVQALCHEIRLVSAAATERIPVHTVFFGGGTPSLLDIDQFSTILATLHEHFDLLPEVEITIEANPGTVTEQYLRELRRIGINRLSFGMQSAHPDDLRLLERQHNFFDVTQAVRWARIAGFDNLSLDLIFGLPGQTYARWQETLHRALGMKPEHLSLYGLTIEHGTPLRRIWGRGLVPLIDDDLAAEMYEFAMDCLESAGFIQYEISNWALNRDNLILSCKHNLQYWHNQPYLGFGPGAHGYAAGVRTVNVGGIKPFIERCQNNGTYNFPTGPATRRVIEVKGTTEIQETMMVGLRLTQEGVSSRLFQDRFSQSLEDSFGPQILRLQKAGLLEWTQEKDPHLRLTRRGRLLGNQVFMEFIG